VGHPLLHTEPARQDPDESGQLADADDPLVGHVAHPRLAHERQGVVLAQGEEGDRPLDHLGQVTVAVAMALGREGGQQLGVAVVPVGRVVEGAQEALRGRVRPRRVEVESQGGQDLGDVRLVAVPIGRTDRTARRGGRGVGATGGVGV
jgi:hypothetical protein